MDVKSESEVGKAAHGGAARYMPRPRHGHAHIIVSVQ